MSDRKVIAVVGATGAQGGGLVRAILNDPKGGFAARVLTRDVNSARTKDFARLGAEVVAVDIDDPESLKKAFEGAYAAFCVTFFWAHFSPEKEIAEAKAMAAAAKATALRHVIWSTLEDTRQWVSLTDNRIPTLQGKYKVLHSDGKGESNHFFTDAGVPTTFLLTSLYWDNFIYFGMGPKKGPGGQLVITFPMGDKKIPGIAAEDIGKCAYGIFKKGDEFIGKTVGISGENLTGAQIAAVFTEVLGHEVRYNNVSPEAYRGLGFPGADSLGNHFQFVRDFEDYFCGARDPNFARSVNPSLQTFKMWLTQNKNAIPSEAVPGLASKKTAISEKVLDQLFRQARTHSAWQPEPVSAELLREAYELARLGPTSANGSPARFVFLTTSAAKARLKPALAPLNVEKTMTAPVTVIIAWDTEFHEKLPRLFPQADMRSYFVGNQQLIDETAFRNSSLQAAYFILAVRALGLDCGPMSGFDANKVNEEFFPDGKWKVNLICNLGYGDTNKLYSRNPRLAFEEAALVL